MGSSTGINGRYNSDGKVEPYGSFNLSRSIDGGADQVKPVSKDSNSKKNLNTLRNSLDNSPGKLMNRVNYDHSMKYKPPKQSPPFGQAADSRRTSSIHKSPHSNQVDFTNRFDTLEDCEKCKRRMRLEQKQTQNIPLTETEKKELNFVKMEMMIFDIRYEELQEHGTLPN